jgi:hypothetical protein
MAMTRLQMVTEICDTVGKALGASAVSGATLQTRVENYYLNWAQRRIANHYSFYDLQQIAETPLTVADVKTYPMEAGTNNLGLSNVATINSIRLIDSENSRKLDFWHYRKFDKWYPRPENFATDRPRIYTRWKNSLILFKIPNDAYSLHIRYGQYASALTSDGQVSDFGEDKDQLLVTAGVLETYLALQEYTDVKIWYELFVGQLVDAVKGEGDDDWEPEAEPQGGPGYVSGEPWLDPYAGYGDPLRGYPE